MPEEVADADALARLTSWRSLPQLGPAYEYVQASSHQRQPASTTELAKLQTLRDGNRDTNNFVCASQDADWPPNNRVEYRVDLQRCAERYVHGVVLARFVGTGRMVRLWLTAGSFLADVEHHEVLRIYVDDRPEARIDVPLSSAMDGSAGEIFAPPFGAGASSWLAWYYPVVFGSKLVIALDQLTHDDLYYYQADAVLDHSSVGRRAPSERLPERDAAAAQLSALANLDRAAQLAHDSFVLDHDAERQVVLEGPATVRALQLSAPNSEFERLSRVQLQVQWDGARAPAIDLPLRDLFAADPQVVERSNAVLSASTSDSHTQVTLQLPMPFRSRAVWSLRNHDAQRATFDLTWFAELDTQQDDAAFGYLHVQRSQAMSPTSDRTRSVARASGRGRLVGLCANLSGHADEAYGWLAGPFNFLEGDLQARVDGRLALDGTGTEDYPDSAFYFVDAPHATPFAQSWSVGLRPDQSSSGRASFCRWHVRGTELDFESDLEVTFELGSGDPSVIELHRTIAFLYLRAPEPD